jgi:hypothetical protein
VVSAGWKAKVRTVGIMSVASAVVFNICVAAVVLRVFFLQIYI